MTEERTDPPLSHWARTWRPPEQVREEVLTTDPSTALAGILDQPTPVAAEGDPLPALWHWTHFLERPAESELGPDGHVRDGGFLPPIPGRHRMFAGGRLEVTEPLRAGERVVRTSRVSSTVAKQGRSGELLFVTEEHVFTVEGRTRMVEHQDIVYRRHALGPRGGSDAVGTGPASAAGPWALRLEPTPAMLFRFSALTYNAHRIHYDHPYTTGVEGFPGLVVHGPLLALAMLEPARRRGLGVRRYAFRLRQPCFVGSPVQVTGEPVEGGVEMAVHGAAEGPAATARVEFEET